MLPYRRSAVSALIALAVCAAVVACKPPSDEPLPDNATQESYALDNLTAAPDEALFAEVLDAIERGRYGELHSLIIIHDDALVLEKYFSGWTRHMLHPCYSVTKSVTSMLVGIAIDRGSLTDVDQKVLSFFPEYAELENPDERKADITLEHLLTMTPGFAWNEIVPPYYTVTGELNPRNQFIEMTESSDWIKYMLDLPLQYDPGETFVYSTGSTHLLSGILTRATGRSAAELAAERLFGPLGISGWEWLADPAGNSSGGVGLSLHPADMAILGYLFLNNGRLDGRQIISQSWVSVSTAAHLVVGGDGPPGGTSDYGYLWWRFNDRYFQRRRPAGAPEVNDLYYASGYGGQYVFIIPHLRLVITATAANFPPTVYSTMDLLFDCMDAVREGDA